MCEIAEKLEFMKARAVKVGSGGEKSF